MTDRHHRSIDIWLADIVRWGERLASHLEGMTFDQFVSDQKAQDAAAKCAEAIGEAAGQILKVEPDFDSMHPGLQLRLAFRSRNRLSHGYFSIDLGLLWNTVTVSIPRTVNSAKVLLATGLPFANKTDGGGDAAGA